MILKNANCKWRAVSGFGLIQKMMRLHFLSFGFIVLIPPSIYKPSHSRSLFSLIFDLIVSHTTDDMIFQWDPSVPLVVDDNIELPQLALVKNHTADCK